MPGHPSDCQKSKWTELWRALERFWTHIQMANMLELKFRDRCAHRTLPWGATVKRTQKPLADNLPAHLFQPFPELQDCNWKQTPTANTHIVYLPPLSLFFPLLPPPSVQCWMCKTKEGWEYPLSINYDSKREQPEDFECPIYKASVTIKSESSGWHFQADWDAELTPVGATRLPRWARLPFSTNPSRDWIFLA